MLQSVSELFWTPVHVDALNEGRRRGAPDVRACSNRHPFALRLDGMRKTAPIMWKRSSRSICSCNSQKKSVRS
ncbi:hypothetical protein KIN20_022567 [Parelaphostrongylus tenuis]|nr:hypothetical protein KIN20_022567 [Parelaphostrongylus tenuis]